MSNPDPTSQPLPSPSVDVLSARWQELRAWRPFGFLQTALQRMPWLWPYGGIALIVIVAMWPAFTTPSKLVISGDAVIIHYPWFVYWRDQISSGNFPLWNPYTFSGFPAFATPQSGYAYPVHWALTWMPAEMAVNWLVGLHVMLAGLGTAWCAGRLGASKDGQFLAGAAFALGSATTARIVAGHLSFVESIAWLPLATGIAVTINERHRVWQLGVVIGLMATAGQPELMIFSGWWVPLWAAGAEWMNGRRRVVIAVVRSLAGLGLGAGLAAFFLLPVAEFEAISNRAGDLAWEFRTGLSLPVWHALGFISPELFGKPAGVFQDPAVSKYWPGPTHFWHENLLYVGLLTVTVAVSARTKFTLLCLGAAAIALILSFGSNTPIYGWIDAVPGYSEFRVPPKHLLLVALAISLAAGIGLEKLNMPRLALGAAIVAIVMLVASLTVEHWLPPLVELLGGSDQVTNRASLRDVVGEAAHPLVLAAMLLGALSLVALLPGEWAKRGIVALAVVELFVVMRPYWAEPISPEIFESDAQSITGGQNIAITGSFAVQANYGPALHIRQPSGYTSMFSGGYQQLVSGFRNPGVAIDLQPGNEPIAYLLGYKAVSERGSNLVNEFSPPPPEAWVSRCSWPGGALAARAPGFPLFKCVTREAAVAQEAVADRAPAEVLEKGEATLKVSAEGPGWLVTTIPWYPGWSARVDGEGRNVEVLDGALVGVELPPGRHTVELSYWPAGLTLGLALSAVSLAVIAGLWYADRRGARWTRFGLEAPDRVVADEADEKHGQEPPQDNLTQAPSP